MDVLKEIYDDISNEENTEYRYAFYYFLFVSGVIFISVLVGFILKIPRTNITYRRPLFVHRNPPVMKEVKKSSPKEVGKIKKPVGTQKRQYPVYRISNLMD